METARARAIAERLHRDDAEEDGTPLLNHVRRVAWAVPAQARAVAWLHEALEGVAVTEHQLLMDGLTYDELRALRLLSRPSYSRSEAAYLGHIELIARAAGHSGELARLVKLVDIADRCRHPHAWRDGWTPPYALALERMQRAARDRDQHADAAVL